MKDELKHCLEEGDLSALTRIQNYHVSISVATSGSRARSADDTEFLFRFDKHVSMS